MRTMHPLASPTRKFALADWAHAIAGSTMLVLALAMHVAPRGDWVYLCGATAVLFALLVGQGWRLAEARLPAPMALALSAFGVLAMAGAMWGAVPGKALSGGAAFAGLVLLAAVASDAIAQLRDDTVRRAAFGLMVGFLAGLAFLIFEVVSHFALQRWIISSVPGLMRQTDKHLHLVHAQLAGIDPANIKRHMAQATVLLWPVALLNHTYWSQRRGWLVSAGLVAATVFAGFLARHDSSNLALAASLLAFLVASVSYRLAWAATAATWLLLTLFIVPLMLLQFQAKAYEQDWIQASGRHRMVIWGYTAGEVLKAPLLGVGAGSGKALDAQRKDVERVPGEKFAFRTGDHQHNVYLQAWYEMGLLGALSLCLAGLVALWRLKRLPESVRSYALATFVTAMFLVSTSYGLWQEWFIASIAISAVALTLALRCASPDAFDLPTRSKA
jgi:hypothetical protein